MDINRKTRVMEIVHDEDLKQVLEWYGLPTNDRSYLRLTLEDYCMEHDVDTEDLIVELTALDAENDDDGDEDEDDLWAWAHG